MKINHYGDNLLGAVAQTNLVEGRMVVLGANTYSRNYGSQSELPGVALPADATAAARARYCVMFEKDNRSTPIYQPHPAYDWALRYGFDQTANAPFSATVYITHPDVQVGQTIPSGSGCLIFGPDSVLTAESGAFVYSASVATPGTLLEVSNTSDHTTDSGKLRAGSTNPIAEVVEFNSTDFTLTFRIL